MANDKGSEIDWSVIIHWLITAALVGKVFGWQYGVVMATPTIIGIVLYTILTIRFRKGI